MFSAKQRHNSTKGHIASIIVLVVCLVSAALLYINRQLILDQVSFWQYQPTPAVASLAERASLSQTGTFYFYASQPAIEDATQFNQECGKKEASTAILGCYNGRTISIYNVTDTKLDGIKEVTAAHEMLHAAYLRLDASEKAHVDSLLEAEYTKLKSDKDFAERMAFYDRTEPGERDNELHSIIGTEVKNINSELETYYQKYFSDRSKVVDLHEKYASIFADLQKRSDTLSQQLTQLEASIESASVKYNADLTQFNKDVDAFKAKTSSGGFTTNQQYQAAREALLARADALDTRRQAIKSDIDRYNQLREELLSIASQSEALNRSINSSLAPAPSL